MSFSVLFRAQRLAPAPGRAWCRWTRRICRLDAHALEHGDEEIGQRVVALAIEGKMLAVPETAAGEEGRQVELVCALALPRLEP